MLRRLLRSFRGSSSEDEPRVLANVADLRPGDLLSLKSRLALPEELRDATLEVSGISTYQYDDGLYLQLTLTATDRSKYYLGFQPQDSEGELCFSKPIGHSAITALFDDDEFAELFDDGFSTLAADLAAPGYAGWLTGNYLQTKNSAVGYYFDGDQRGSRVSDRQDDGSEPLRYHELRGEDDQYEITVEIWGDGETDVSLDVYSPADVIESLWPAA